MVDLSLNKKISTLTEVSKSQLALIFDSYPGTKDLILEPRIIKPLERICGVRWLKSHNVQKIYKLSETIPTFHSSYQFYIIYTNWNAFKTIQSYVQENSTTDKVHIIFVPKPFAGIEEHLESIGLYEPIVKLHPFHWMPIELDLNILSLELPNVYKNLYVQKDLSFLPICAKTLWMLSFVLGKPKFILALGNLSNIILKQWDLFRECKGDTDKTHSDFGAAIIIDRSIDYASTLLTPSTYSALLNDVYGVDCGVCEYKDDRTNNDKNNVVIKKQPVRFELNSKRDRIYNEIKNCYFTEVTSKLSTSAKEMRSINEKSKTMSLTEIKQYVSSELQNAAFQNRCLSDHLAAAETIVRSLGHRFERLQEIESSILTNCSKSTILNQLDEINSTENDKLLSLRIFCLIALTQRLTEQEINSFLLKFQNEFGPQYGFIVHNLIRAEFLNSDQISSNLNLAPKLPNFFANANRLKQIPSDPSKIKVHKPTCPSYVFAGNYIPLIIQLINSLLTGCNYDELKSKFEPLGPLTIKSKEGYPITLKRFFVYVIGGVTYAEIAACNLLESLTGCSIVICSDKIISGNNIAEAMLHLYD